MPRHLLVATLCFFLLGNNLMSQVKEPVEIAKRHLQENLQELDLTAADIADLVVSDNYFSKHNKVSHVYLIQRHQGIEVFNAMINVNILENGEILYLGNRAIKDLSSKVNSTTPEISMEAAVELLIEHFGKQLNAELEIQERISDTEVIFKPGNIALEPIKVELSYQPMPDNSVKLSWNVMYAEMNGQHWWDARVDALTGEVLTTFDMVLHCSFPDKSTCGHDHSIVGKDDTPKIGLPLKTEQFEISSTNLGGSYRAYPLTIESPSHGQRELLTGTEDLVASPFGWHDTNGSDGVEYTITRGNNVHAYQDYHDLNRSVGDEPDGGEELIFDYDINFSESLPFKYVDAATTNLFYWNNITHDLWYHYGFDEASGNFQDDNYGNGGFGGDYVRAEALDGSGTNNANFGTPPDGDRPRMQMYLWGGSLPGYNYDIEVVEPAIVLAFTVLEEPILEIIYQYLMKVF